MKPREPRRKVLIKARMRMESRWDDVCIRDISSRGLLLQSPSAPGPGRYFELCRGHYVVVGRVVWTDGERFGVRTQDRLDVEAFVNELDLSAAAFRPRDTGWDRRARPRPNAAQIVQQAERNRRFARLFDFACHAAFCASIAFALFGMVQNTLTRPLEAVTAQLGRD